VKNDYGTEKEALALNGLEEPLKKKNCSVIIFTTIQFHLRQTEKAS
jgi:hypothetical protein